MSDIATGNPGLSVLKDWTYTTVGDIKYRRRPSNTCWGLRYGTYTVRVSRPPARLCRDQGRCNPRRLRVSIGLHAPAQKNPLAWRNEPMVWSHGVSTGSCEASRRREGRIRNWGTSRSALLHRYSETLARAPWHRTNHKERTGRRPRHHRGFRKTFP